MEHSKSHLPPSESNFAEELNDAIAATLEKSRYLDSLARSREDEVEWEIREANTLARAKQLLQDSEDISKSGTISDAKVQLASIVDALEEDLEKLGTYMNALDQLLKGKRTPEEEVNNLKEILSNSKAQYDELITRYNSLRNHLAKMSSQTRNHSSSMLSLSISLPPLISVREYILYTSNVLNALDFSYLIFAILLSGKQSAIKQLLASVRKSSSTISKGDDLPSGLYSDIQIEPLRLASMHYGSPASFDLLGVGKVIEILRDTVKDLAWRGNYEKEQARMNVEITKLEAKKTKAEIASKKRELEKLKLENEKLALEVADQKLELIIKTINLRVSDTDKTLLTSVLLPQLNIIIQHSPTLLQSGGDDNLLPLTNNVKK